jgi:hypothetical protein
MNNTLRIEKTPPEYQLLPRNEQQLVKRREIFIESVEAQGPQRKE